jgi:hypothetical protein
MITYELAASAGVKAAWAWARAMRLVVTTGQRGPWRYPLVPVFRRAWMILVLAAGDEKSTNSVRNAVPPAGSPPMSAKRAALRAAASAHPTCLGVPAPPDRAFAGRCRHSRAHLPTTG